MQIKSAEELNAKIRDVQSQISRHQGFIDSQKQTLEQVRAKAILIFGTDDVNQIREKINQIREKNDRIIRFKSVSLATIEQCLTLINNRQSIPQDIMDSLVKLSDKARANAEKRLSAQSDTAQAE